MKDYEIDEDIAAFEAELRQLKPARFEPKLRPPNREPKRTHLALFLTHSVGLLLGMLLGGGLVHFLHKPVVVVQIVEKEAVPDAKIDPVPVVTPVERQQYAQIAFDIDGMIEQYNRRSKLLANLPPSRAVFSPASLEISNDPNSLLLLRESMKL